MARRVSVPAVFLTEKKSDIEDGEASKNELRKVSLFINPVARRFSIAFGTKRSGKSGNTVTGWGF